MDKKALINKLIDIPYLIVAGVVYSVAYNMFLVPGNIFVGGIGGLATVWNVLYGFPTGLVILILNIPLIIGLMIVYGMRSSIKSIIGIATGSLFVYIAELLDLFPPAFANPGENKLLYAIFGGVTLGVSIGLFFSRGYTTGGTDIIALLLKPKFKKLSTSNLILLTDVVTITYAAIAMKDWLTVLYSFVAVLMSTGVLGLVSGGFDKGGILYIFSPKNEDIANAISTRLARGVTMLDGMGWYTKNPEKIIMCVVKKSEIYQLKLIVREIDPGAFMIVSESMETIGQGFKQSVGESQFIERQKRKKEKNNTKV
ncbi:MAG: YitT family protein [Clostridia bacterium]|nr:YitT family protein [Clostridia bacterium]